MKKKIRVALFIELLFGLSQLVAQAPPAIYVNTIREADSLYSIGLYEDAAWRYSAAFKSLGWKGYMPDRYNAACAWALINNADSAFFNLERIANKQQYGQYRQLSRDKDLLNLHQDARWPALLVLVRSNRNKTIPFINESLVNQLDTILASDQDGRYQLDDLEEAYGLNSNEVKTLWRQINYQDSLNLIKVKAILNQYGWLGRDVLGAEANQTLFLVIQHADLGTQETYLPMMREAVAKANASGADLALLEDRVALRQGRKQIYGSQIGSYPNSNRCFVSPLEDPDNVDKRRASVNMRPLADYVAIWGIQWDVEQYKKDLPEIELIDKANRGLK